MSEWGGGWIQIDGGDEELARAEKLLAGIPNGVERAIKSAAPRAASHLRTQSTKKIRERYAISAGNIRSNENVRMSYSAANGGLVYDIYFSGMKIPLYRYSGTSPTSPSWQSGRVPVPIGDEWRMARPGVNARAHVLASTGPTTLANTFIAKFASGHYGIFERTGGVTGSGRDQISEVMGLSVAQMVGNEEVATALTEEAAEKFNERLEHEITRLLAGLGG